MNIALKQYRFKKHGDLLIDKEKGIAIQENPQKFDYNEEYFKHYESLENTDSAWKINSGRHKILEEFYAHNGVVDIGIGSGDFIKSAGPFTIYGYDISQKSRRYLLDNGIMFDIYARLAPYERVSVFTCWDSLEHFSFKDQGMFLKRIVLGTHLIVSMPIMDDIIETSKSKHYKPNEHLYYFTRQGFVDYMVKWGFVSMKIEDFEMKAGRENVYTFVFNKVANESVEKQIKEAIENSSSNTKFFKYDDSEPTKETSEEKPKASLFKRKRKKKSYIEDNES